MKFLAFQKKATELGLIALDKGNNHWQIKGKFLVNYYPERGTCYIAGTNKGFRLFELEQVFKTASEFPKEMLAPVERKKSPYTKYKMQLLRRHPFCKWCAKKLTKETGTIDHLIPLSKGGLNNPNNYVLACEPCNSKRGNTV